MQTRVIENVVNVSIDIDTSKSNNVIDDPQNKQTSIVEYMSDVVDHETDMYMGTGVIPARSHFR